jgi:hypothetical protein
MNNSRKKTGQAAMEFLTTYGWAFLVIIVVIGALYTFGVFDTTSRMPDSCSLSGMIDCSGGFLVSATTNETQLNIRNDGMNAINVTTIDIKAQSSETYCTSQSSTSDLIRSSGSGDVTFTFNDLGETCGLVVGDKTIMDIRVYYKSGTSEIETPVTGKLTATIV